MTITYKTGDAVYPEEPPPLVICQIVNDAGRYGAGFSGAVARRWPRVEEYYRAMAKTPRSGFRLGATQTTEVEPGICVCNMVAQHGTRSVKNPQPIRYDALVECLGSLAAVALELGAVVVMPLIGAGLAGGDWRVIEGLIESRLCAAGVAVTVYDLPGT